MAGVDAVSRVIKLAAVAVLSGCAASTAPVALTPVSAVQSRCAPDTLAVVHQLRYTLGRIRDTAEWSVFKNYLPVRDSTKIRLITEESVCRRAATVYTANTGDTARAARRRVTVVQAGDRYVITDPFTPQMGGEWAVRLIVDRDWKVLVRLGT